MNSQCLQERRELSSSKMMSVWAQPLSGFSELEASRLNDLHLLKRRSWPTERREPIAWSWTFNYLACLGWNSIEACLIPADGRRPSSSRLTMNRPSGKRRRSWGVRTTSSSRFPGARCWAVSLKQFTRAMTFYGQTFCSHLGSMNCRWHIACNLLVGGASLPPFVKAALSARSNKCFPISFSE